MVCTGRDDITQSMKPVRCRCCRARFVDESYYVLKAENLARPAMVPSSPDNANGGILSVACLWYFWDCLFFVCIRTQWKW